MQNSNKAREEICSNPDAGSRAFKVWRRSLSSATTGYYVNEVLTLLANGPAFSHLSILKRKVAPRTLELVDIRNEIWVGMTLRFDKNDAAWFQVHAWIIGHRGYRYEEVEGGWRIVSIDRSEATEINAEACYWLIRSNRNPGNVIGLSRLEALFSLNLPRALRNFFFPRAELRRELRFFEGQACKALHELAKLRDEGHFARQELPRQLGEHWRLAWLRGEQLPYG